MRSRACRGAAVKVVAAVERAAGAVRVGAAEAAGRRARHRCLAAAEGSGRVEGVVAIVRPHDLA